MCGVSISQIVVTFHKLFMFSDYIIFKGRSRNGDDSGMYDAPWGDVDTVIDSIIKKQIQHAPKMSKESRRHSAMPIKTSTSVEKKKTMPIPVTNRQMSFPDFR